MTHDQVHVCAAINKQELLTLPCIEQTVPQYRALITNSGTPFFLVGTQDIGPHEVSQCLIHVPISTSFLYNPCIPFPISGYFFIY